MSLRFLQADRQGYVEALDHHPAVLPRHKGQEDRAIQGHAGDEAVLVVDVRAQRGDLQGERTIRISSAGWFVIW